MCIPRIQEAKLEMKKSGKKKLEDGAIKLACQQSCPADAIVFGDLNDTKSKISKLLGDKRSYHLLAELNVMPRVSYLTKVRNKD
jgi:molybdopterin-containing oxidoreductase family iron-sulfur binding subunit